jgi:hypothetical protein
VLVDVLVGVLVGVSVFVGVFVGVVVGVDTTPTTAPVHDGTAGYVNRYTSSSIATSMAPGGAQLRTAYSPDYS